MKSSKEFITQRLDELALQYHAKFYCDLSDELQQTIWAMAQRQYADYYRMKIDNTFDRIRENSKKQWIL